MAMTSNLYISDECFICRKTFNIISGLNQYDMIYYFELMGLTFRETWLC